LHRVGAAGSLSRCACYLRATVRTDKGVSPDDL